jgi:AraC-like DNA-binding protein
MKYFESSIYILTGIIGFLTVFLLSFSFRSNKSVNIFLFLIISGVSLRMLLLGTFEMKLQTFGKDFPEPYHAIFLITIPLFYFYIKSLVTESKSLKWKHLLHFIFPVIVVLSFFKNSLFTENFFALPITLKYSVILAFSFLYLIKIFHLLKTRLWQSKHTINNKKYIPVRNWTNFLFVLVILLTLRNLISFTIDFSTNSTAHGYPLSLIPAIIWLIVFGKILISPEILHGLPKLQEKLNKLENESIVIHDFWNYGIAKVSNLNDLKLKEKLNSKILNLIEEIELITKEKNLFRNQKISISDVANEIGIPVSHVVYLFKYHCKISFTEFKTIHKIEDAKRLIDAGYLKTNTLESLAFHIGFSSYSPFFIAFKKLTGFSPNEFVVRPLTGKD